MDRLIRRVKQIRDFCVFRLVMAWLQGGRCVSCGRFVGLRPICGRCLAGAIAESEAEAPTSEAAAVRLLVAREAGEALGEEAMDAAEAAALRLRAAGMPSCDGCGACLEGAARVWLEVGGGGVFCEICGHLHGAQLALSNRQC